MELSPAMIAFLLERPALPPPKGVNVTTVTNRSSEQDAIVIYGACALGITGVFMLVRLYTKIRIVRKVDLSDYIAILGFILYAVFLAIGRNFISEGAGVHQWNLQLKHLINMLYWLNIQQILFACTLVTIKIGILLQYLAIFAPNRTVSPYVYFGARILIVLHILCYTAICTLNNLACNPRERIWNPLVTRGHCIPKAREIDNYFLPAFNVASDATILALPAASIWQLHIPLRKKIGITLQLAIGVLAWGASMAQLVSVLRMSKPGADTSYWALGLSTGAITEILLGIIVSCTITYHKLFKAKRKEFRAFFSKIGLSILSSRQESETKSWPQQHDFA